MTLEAFRLPEENVQIAFSGGRTSAYMLHQILEANGDLKRNNVRVIFANTGREMPQTLDFVQKVQDQWDVCVDWVEYRPNKPWHEVVSYDTASRNGEPFDFLIKKRKMLPNIAMRFCTQEMKIKSARRLCRSFGWDQWQTACGIRFDELTRARPSFDKRIINWFPLVNGKVDKADIIAFWQKQSFDLDLPLVENGNPFGNCDGCFLKSESSKALLHRMFPERSQWWQDQEKKLNATFRDGMKLSEIADFVDRQGDWIFDTQGALCQADDGECTE